MERLIPLVFVLFLYLIIGLSRAKKAGQRQTPPRPGTDARAPQPPAAGQKPVAEQRPAGPAPSGPSPVSELRPEHEEGTGWGSLDVETGEGEDPCHEEQLAGMASLQAAESAAANPAELPAQPLLTGNDLVRGFIIGEILRRKQAPGGYGKQS